MQIQSSINASATYASTRTGEDQSTWVNNVQTINVSTSSLIYHLAHISSYIYHRSYFPRFAQYIISHICRASLQGVHRADCNQSYLGEWPMIGRLLTGRTVIGGCGDTPHGDWLRCRHPVQWLVAILTRLVLDFGASRNVMLVLMMNVLPI